MNTFRWISLLLFAVLSSDPTPAQGQTTQSGQSSPFSQAKFVPDISLILDCSYLLRSLPDDSYAILGIPGSHSSHEEDGSHRGFNLNYAEITFYSIVDPYFELFAVCHVSEHHFHLEEAYWLTKKFPAGFQLKIGKFLSSFGRINEQHTHYWDFADRPLVFEAAFGREGLNEIGARMTWVSPLETYLMVGGEILMGENEESFGRTGIHAEQGPVEIGSVNGPGLVLGYCKASFDVGDASLLLGVSACHGSARIDEGFSAGVADGEALAGHTTIVGGDVTMKYLFDAIRYLSVQSEFLYRTTDANRYVGATQGSLSQIPIERRQSGFYLQAVMKTGLQWRAGLRYDALLTNEIVEGGSPLHIPERLDRLSGMVDFNPTEFSRFRIQYTYDRSRFSHTDHTFTRSAFHELSFQVNLAIGAHGAHAF